MKSTVLENLEKDNKFKRLFVPRSYILKNLAMVAPACLLFLGLFGVIYLQNINQLVSWYAIPYIVIFAVGTVWLKAVRQHITRTAINKEGAFLVCWAAPVEVKDKKQYFIFSTGSRRHDRYYIENLRKESGSEKCMEKASSVKHGKAIPIENDIYISALKATDLKRKNPRKDDSESFPVLYVDDKHIYCVQGRYLN
ncbi:hypothetical protein M2132_000291 [Dysgonomonas sp. PH5-45]|uniref:hypothetical protein n=1 Tax=unclassified Dysgonomonas TaxID=2630389 RepID=UPI0024743296|nr:MULTISPECIES: hypothetical protein [unclassified Dysgonomonas]MDH6353971.1 hypothetical protein [Dysgonomonas sp. PH5-45]MDH6386873.1 hypothetical protein [Dysgonomonas sp. PH5-37]